MGKLSCGCEISPGSPLPQGMVSAHKIHLTLVFWGMLVLPNASPELKACREALMMARIAYQKALDAAYPSSEGGRG